MHMCMSFVCYHDNTVVIQTRNHIYSNTRNLPASTSMLTAVANCMVPLQDKQGHTQLLRKDCLVDQNRLQRIFREK